VESETIRARRIELVNQHGERTFLLSGGGGDGDDPGITIYSPDGPQAVLIMNIKRENSAPQLVFKGLDNSAILFTIDKDGPVVYLESDNGAKKSIRP
jgi:hypothetical protein